MSWIGVKSVCKPYQTLPACSVHFLPLGPGSANVDRGCHAKSQNFHVSSVWLTWIEDVTKNLKISTLAVHFLPLGPGSPVAPALLGTGDPGPRGFI